MEASGPENGNFRPVFDITKDPDPLSSSMVELGPLKPCGRLIFIVETLRVFFEFVVKNMRWIWKMYVIMKFQDSKKVWQWMNIVCCKSVKFEDLV